MTEKAYLPVCTDGETDVDCITREITEMKILLPSKEIIELPAGISLLDAIIKLKQHNAALTGVVYKGYYQTRSIN